MANLTRCCLATIAAVAETRLHPTGVDEDQDHGVGNSWPAGDGIWLKQPLLHAVSAVERMRIWLLKQAWFHSSLLPALPRRLRWILRRMYLRAVDRPDQLLGRSDPGLPPRALMFTAPRPTSRQWQARAEHHLQCYRREPSVPHPRDRLRNGRLAIALPAFLDASGRYEGFDIVPEGIEWCWQHIARTHDNINFTLADVYNQEYNPEGQDTASGVSVSV